MMFQIIHVVADGYSQLFTLAGLTFGIPVVGSFHTDILDLLNTHGAYEVQKLLVTTKERIDSFVLDSCATTSESFKVTNDVIFDGLKNLLSFVGQVSQSRSVL